MSDQNQGNLTPEDKRLIVEGRLLNTLSKFGGKRIVDGKIMTQLQKEIIDEFYKMRDEGLL